MSEVLEVLTDPAHMIAELITEGLFLIIGIVAGDRWHHRHGGKQ